MATQSIKLLMIRLWGHISNRRRTQFWLLLVIILLTSVSEIFSIGLVLPFLGVLISPERIFSDRAAQPFINIFGLTEPSQFLLFLTVAFGLAAICAGAMRLLLLWASTRYSYGVGADLGIDIYRRTLYQSYAVHCSRNSSQVISGISSKTNGTISVINALLTLVSSVVILIAILTALIIIDPYIALLTFFGFGFIYVSIIYFARRRLVSNGERIALESTRVIKSLQEGLGGIRDVLMDGAQEIYCETYRSADLPLRHAQGSNLFIIASPRYAMEALGMLVISLLAYLLVLQVDGFSKAIPILGALALGAQRLLPILQQVYAAWVTILGGAATLQDTIELLDQPLPKHAGITDALPIRFNQMITLKKIGFRYSPHSPYIFNNLDLNIIKGSRVGFIGSTGSGKSTLLDIIMGLLRPTEGSVMIDDQVITPSNNSAWQMRIAHVPQVIFLADGTIEENIAFGVPINQIDHERVKRAAYLAQISDVIESWHDKYHTFVGERGIRLSGGQRQRIGIARALYKEAEVIIFDEATSALDNETEQAVMNCIESLSDNLTILIIAHRLTTLKNCTQIIELGNGAIRQSGNYQDIIRSKVY